MDYDLAKKLKEAGFPQKKLDISDVYVGVCRHGLYGFSEGRESCECGESETVHLPSLSELIAACGEKFSSLEKRSDGWRATSHEDPDNFKGFDTLIPWLSCVGSTPEEAVANLWLALNKKP